MHSQESGARSLKCESYFVFITYLIVRLKHRLVNEFCFLSTDTEKPFPGMKYRTGFLEICPERAVNFNCWPLLKQNYKSMEAIGEK